MRKNLCSLCSLSPLILLLTLAVVASPLRAQETSLVVSPDGPITSLEEARLQVRELKKKHPDQPIEAVSYTHLTLPTIYSV